MRAHHRQAAVCLFVDNLPFQAISFHSDLVVNFPPLRIRVSRASICTCVFTSVCVFCLEVFEIENTFNNFLNQFACPSYECSVTGLSFGVSVHSASEPGRPP